MFDPAMFDPVMFETGADATITEPFAGDLMIYMTTPERWG